MVNLEEISSYLQKGRANEVKELVQQALNEGMDVKKILEEGLILIAARAMNAGTALLKPYLVSSGVKAKGKVVIGTVKGDLHDIGKNLVKMMMEGKGLEVIDLGTDVPADKFITAAKENHADIIACSALLTTTMTEMQNVVKAAKEAGIRDKITIMVGGAPVTDAFCKSIGADVYAPDAAGAADAAVAACSK